MPALLPFMSWQTMGAATCCLMRSFFMRNARPILPWNVNRKLHQKNFATADVELLGSGLKVVEKAVQRYELKSVQAADRRFAATLKVHIAAISITLSEPKP